MRLTNDDKTVNWEGFRYFLNAVALNEPRLLTLESNKRYISSVTFDQAITIEQGVVTGGDASIISRNLDYGKFRQAWYYHELSPKGNPDDIKRFVDALGYDPFVITMDKVNEMVSDYMTGIAWCLSYYYNGVESINKRWYYKYSHAPLFVDMFNYVNTLTGPSKTLWKDVPEYRLPHVFHQLALVTPPKSIGCIPYFLKSLYNPDSAIYDMHPYEYIIDYELKVVEWME